MNETKNENVCVVEDYESFCSSVRIFDPVPDDQVLSLNGDLLSPTISISEE